jgi:hypothetical protein
MWKMSRNFPTVSSQKADHPHALNWQHVMEKGGMRFLKFPWVNGAMDF